MGRNINRQAFSCTRTRGSLTVLQTSSCAKDGEAGISTLKAGKKYLVLDAGGGTIDITVHEVCVGGNLKEIHRAGGGHWGGTRVDEAFMAFIGKIVDKSTFLRFKDENMEDYVELLRDFEVKRGLLKQKRHIGLQLKIPLSLIDLVKDVTQISMKDKIRLAGYGDKVSLIGDKLRLDAEVTRSFFNTSVSKLTWYVSDLLQKPECNGVEAILMVGGFSECMLLQETIKQRFSKQLKIFVPPEAGIAVLKGAVIYGHCPNAITERVTDLPIV